MTAVDRWTRSAVEPSGDPATPAQPEPTDEVGPSALTGVVLRPMRPRHLGAVLDIERRVYPRPWSPGVFATELSHTDDRWYLVALARLPRRAARRLGERLGRRGVVGYGGVLVAAGEAHITTVAVEPALHRRKIASHLLLELLDAARAAGATAATLEARVANHGAQRLYRNFGFAPVGVRPGYYAETGEDALIMWAHDLQSDEVAARLDVQRARLGDPGGASGVGDLHVPWVRGRVGLIRRPDAASDARQES